MRVSSLSLHNFRNFKSTEDIVFPKGALLVAVAPNAVGKTNFLEAVVMLLRGRSFRARSEECVKWGEDAFLVRGEIKRGGGISDVAVQYQSSSRKMHIKENGTPVSPVVFYSHYPFVLFLSEDTYMFARGPAARRNFFNTALVSSPQYLSAVVQYHRALRQRNTALKTAQSPDDVAAWTSLLIEYAQQVWLHRNAFVDYLSANVNDLYAQMFGEELEFAIDLSTGAPDPDRFAELLHDAWKYERNYRYTLYGPHRDDLRVLIDGRSLNSSLSRGQMRGLVISLKVAAYGYVKQVSGQKPIMLFDEVLSELDGDRQRLLLHHLPDHQTLLTCTSIPDEVRRRDGVQMLDLQSIIDDSHVEKPSHVAEVDVSEEDELDVVAEAVA